MPADGLVSLAQLSIRAGKYARGDALIPSIQKKQANCVLLSSSCGANRSKKITDKCAFYHIPLYVLDPQRFDAISPAVSGAMAILDPGMADGIRKYMKEKDGD